MAAKLNPHIVNWKTMPLPLPSYILPGFTKEYICVDPGKAGEESIYKLR